MASGGGIAPVAPGARFVLAQPPQPGHFVVYELSEVLTPGEQFTGTAVAAPFGFPPQPLPARGGWLFDPAAQQLILDIWIGFQALGRHRLRITGGHPGRWNALTDENIRYDILPA